MESSTTEDWLITVSSFWHDRIKIKRLRRMEIRRCVIRVLDANVGSEDPEALHDAAVSALGTAVCFVLGGVAMAIAMGYELVPAYLSADLAGHATLAATADTLAAIALVINAADNFHDFGVGVPL